MTSVSLVPAPGETSLEALLATLTLTLHSATFVFITFPAGSRPSPTLKDTARMVFQEAEGTTVITTLESAQAEHITDYTFPCKMITCNVHSSLEAVGFMAVIAKRLGDVGMGVNPVSGFFHDHLFVPLEREEQAMAGLNALASEAKIGHAIE